MKKKNANEKSKTMKRNIISIEEKHPYYKMIKDKKSNFTANNIIYSFESDIGKRRENNEDRLYSFEENDDIINKSNPLFIVADGMGGYEGGEIASKIAVEEASKYIKEKIFANTYSSTPIPLLIFNDKSKNKDSFYKDIISGAINEANQKIIKESQRTTSLANMGSTIVIVLFPFDILDHFYIANVGDSRAYLINCKNETITQLSKDHTIAEEMIKDKVITKEKARTHKFKHVLTHSLGTITDSNFDLKSNINCIQWNENDYLLLCSDGLTDMLEDEEIKLILLKQQQQYPKENVETKRKNLKKICQDLVKNANEKGGRDNITVILIQNTGK